MRGASRYTHLMPAARYFSIHSTIHIQTRGIGGKGRGWGLVVVREASRYTHLMPAARYFSIHSTIHIQTRGIGGGGLVVVREASRYTHLMPAARYFSIHSTIHIQTRGEGEGVGVGGSERGVTLHPPNARRSVLHEPWYHTYTDTRDWGGGLVVVREASRYTHLMPAARYFTSHGTIHIQTRGIGGRGGGGWVGGSERGVTLHPPNARRSVLHEPWYHTYTDTRDWGKGGGVGWW